MSRGRGRGRPNFAWEWEDNDQPRGSWRWSFWKLSSCDFVPYSHLEPPGAELRTFFTGEQQAILCNQLGGLYTVPPDLRCSLPFQACELEQLSWDSAIHIASEFSGLMTTLNEVGGSFTIRDFDDTDLHSHTKMWVVGGRALYGCVKSRDRRNILKTTAQEAEEYFLNIPPIPKKDIDLGETGSPLKALPWRRVMYA
jgi:hypothetical protein